MPSLKTLLKDVMEKFPEIKPDKIGIQYENLKDADHGYKQGPLEGVLLDKDGTTCDYVIEIGENMKHPGNLVKVGAIANRVSSIYHHRKETLEASTGKQILQAILGRDRFTYKDHRWCGAETESLHRGFGRQIDALNKYLDR